MSRGISRDRLSDKVAEQVRNAAREAKSLKRVTYASIAVYMGWEARRVVDMLASGRPLRGENARELLAALWNMAPRNAAAAKLLRKAWDLTGRAGHNPPVLIPPWTIDHLAEHLADELGRKPGIGTRRRATFEKDVRYAIGRTAAGMALSFFDACWARFSGDATAGEVLKRFGYGAQFDGDPTPREVLKRFGYSALYPKGKT